MENERTGGRAGGKRIDERADFGALRNGIAACVVAIHCVHALYTAFPTTAGEVKGHFISPHNGIHRNPLAHARRGLTTVTLAHAHRGLIT